MTRSRCLLALPIAVMLLSCSTEKTQANRRDTMTKRQRDSVLGQSRLPGAQGVTKALKASDAEKARLSGLDTIRDTMP
jgi:hypothetical protein